MTPSQVDTFIMLIKTKSFTGAANALNISQSAVSHSLKSLENTLGVKLFERHSKIVELTTFGQKISRKIYELDNILRQIEQESTAYKGLKSGYLTIGSFGPSFTGNILPPYLKKFKSRFPDIQVIIEEFPDDEVVQAIMDRKVELGGVILPQNDLECIEIAQDKIVAILPPDHPLTDKNIISLHDLCNDPFIMVEGGEMIEKAFQDAKLKPNIICNNAQISSMISLVAGGHGISLDAEFVLPQLELYKKPPVVIRPLSVDIERKIGLAMPYYNRLTPASKAFADIIYEDVY